MGKARSATQNGNEKLVIVPDSCSMNLAGAKIPPNFFKPGFKGKKPEHFYDMYLDFLPLDKVKGIHILDIVGGELFGRDSHGVIYDDRFAEMISSKGYDLRPLADRIYLKKDPFITIVPTLQGHELMKVFAGIRQLEGQIAKYLGTLPSDDKTKHKDREIKSSLKTIRKNLGRDRGEKIVGNYLVKHHNPTLFISDDRMGRRNVADACEHNTHGCVYIDNTVGVMAKLKEAGVFDACGFQPWVTPEMVMVEMRSALSARTSISQHSMTPDLRSVPGSSRKCSQPKPLEDWFSPSR